VTTNSSVNFIIYCIFGEKFKRIFLRSVFEFLGRNDYSLPGGEEIIRYPNNSSASHQATAAASLSRPQSFLLRAGGSGGAGGENSAGNAALRQAVGDARCFRNGPCCSAGGTPLYVHSCCELGRRASTESYRLCGALRSCANLPRICVHEKVFLLRAVGKRTGNKADENYN